jgi:GTP-binding protein HflX|tara:strand:+ start:1836 stop:3119 length:1284 start_codon:yes stop_codon:yes gene_type:complete
VSLSTTRTLIIHPDIKKLRNNSAVISGSINESVSLSMSLKLVVIATKIIKISTPRAGYLFGKGSTLNILNEIKEHKIDLIIVNGDISPIQQRNLEKVWQVKLIDRTHLILEIFADRAATREGKLQVDLATLSYQRTRLVRSWTHLERQRGGLGFVGGPGETQIESDRRAIDNAIVKIKSQLSKVVKTRSLHRKSRQKVPYPIVTLIGYTNAGKSTLFNTLTGAKVLAKDMLFATLDPTMRSINLNSMSKVILSDTVGFISDLPTELIAAFRATLEEVLHADLIIHVRDIADENTNMQFKQVNSILNSLGVETELNEKIIEVYNKIDLLSRDQLEMLKNKANRSNDFFLVSSTVNKGIDELINGVEKALNKDLISEVIKIGFDKSYVRSKLYQSSVIQSEKLCEDGYEIAVRWSKRKQGEFYNLLNIN